MLFLSFSFFPGNALTRAIVPDCQTKCHENGIHGTKLSWGFKMGQWIFGDFNVNNFDNSCYSPSACGPPKMKVFSILSPAFFACLERENSFARKPLLRAAGNDYPGFFPLFFPRFCATKGKKGLGRCCSCSVPLTDQSVNARGRKEGKKDLTSTVLFFVIWNKRNNSPENSHGNTCLIFLPLFLDRFSLSLFLGI